MHGAPFHYSFRVALVEELIARLEGALSFLEQVSFRRTVRGYPVHDLDQSKALIRALIAQRSFERQMLLDRIHAEQEAAVRAAMVPSSERAVPWRMGAARGDSGLRAIWLRTQLDRCGPPFGGKP